MTPSLVLLDGVRWHGEPVLGDRVAPANPAQARQVLVSRVRDRLGADAVGRTATGYRLALAAALASVRPRPWSRAARRGRGSRWR